MIRQDPKCKNLKIIVTSATLDVRLFSNYFGRCPIVEIPGRMFPVKDIYRPPQNNQLRLNIVKEVVDCIFHVHTNSALEEGDILSFLPGQREVDEAIGSLHRLLNAAAASGVRSGEGPLQAQVLPLFGQQEPEEQKPVFSPALANHRKIVIATNVAETSVTIDGVCFVIDSGLEKKVRI
jgi:HrpA-like RNA helicase